MRVLQVVCEHREVMHLEQFAPLVLPTKHRVEVALARVRRSLGERRTPDMPPSCLMMLYCSWFPSYCSRN